MGDLSTHFNRSEFACKCGCGADHVSMELVTRLERLRSFLRIPIVIRSGVRCRTYNAKVGGKPDSAHITGEAADIACSASKTRYLMKRWIYVWALFSRIGTGKDYLHLDVSVALPLEVEWTYY